MAVAGEYMAEVSGGNSASTSRPYFRDTSTGLYRRRREGAQPPVVHGARLAQRHRGGYGRIHTDRGASGVGGGGGSDSSSGQEKKNWSVLTGPPDTGPQTVLRPNTSRPIRHWHPRCGEHFRQLSNSAHPAIRGRPIKNEANDKRNCF